MERSFASEIAAVQPPCDATGPVRRNLTLRALITRRSFFAGVWGLALSGAAGVAWKALRQRAVSAPAEDAESFEDIENGASLLGRRILFTIHMNTGETATVPVTIVPYGEELLLRVRGRCFSPNETYGGKNVTHSAWTKDVVKEGDGIAVDTIAGRGSVDMASFMQNLARLASAREDERSVRFQISFTYTSYTYTPPFHIGPQLVRDSHVVDMRRIPDLE